ncbi:PREDICTED: titin-like, partial [Tinamus guttatus]|uniref:titin-like n=1 Tax=Tinamus guttatus TaxID=94827 RepID=UPI00052EC75F
AEKWEMPKETIKESDEGGLVRLKYTFKYADKFIEPDDDWLKSIETLSDELLGAFSKAENTALSAAFGGRKKKRLNRVFDAIGFFYPDYCYPIRRQKRKKITSEKEDAAAPSEPEPKRKKIKVLTHRPRYIEPASVPEFTGKTSSATEAEKLIEPALLPEIAETAEKTEAPLTEKIEEVREATEGSKTSEVLSPTAIIGTAKNQKGPSVTPKRKRMVNVLDVLETIKSSSTTPKNSVEVAEASTEASTQQAEAEAGPSEPFKEHPFEAEAVKIPEPASGKKLSEEEAYEANHYAKELKYPKGAVIFNGTNEDDFLYCLPDNKELSVCREMARSIGFPKLESGLSAMTKEDLADSLAYNSLK